ncbi:unnamed protein product [Polarella glacialis]|uniref:Uncharacterized protein n=1 Tax=Polarella glacialis TaxID=89957 RepID=A0A813JGS6_POLGL|nr:unnamed protein product [Polarella glacialis]|mmetsp:Transcript_14659/g.23279  ORF Transcript_14659/g.23279 Transcript_14659/m.23279 type:complete len:117 (+) Transcript_14659:95-445(+)
MSAPAQEEASAVVNGDAEAEVQPSIWEVIDELISVPRATLAKILGVALSILCCVSSWLIYREVNNGRLDLAALHGGFLLLVFGLMGSVAFVLFEAGRLEGESAEGSPDQVENKKTD